MNFYSNYDNKNYYDSRFVDLKGYPIERTPFSHPYNYDSYVQWKGEYIENEGSSVYSDRMYSWDPKKYNKCCEEVWGNTGQYLSERNPKDIEQFLNLYFEKEIELTAVVQCCNQLIGFPYWCFYYKDKEKELEKE